MGDAKVILWDVYGTLLEAERGDLDSLVRREGELRAAFEQTVEDFRLDVPAAILHDSFLRAIAAERESRLERGATHPEVRIEEIWLQLLEKFHVAGGVTLPLAREVGLFFEGRANPKRFQPHAFETLCRLRGRGLRLGIISNAQFYTLIEISDLIRGASEGNVGGYECLFDPLLVFLSCDLGVAKPDLTAFERCLQVVGSEGVRPPECLFIGDSLANDIAPALQVGMSAVLYAPHGAPAGAERAVAIQDLRQVLDLV